MELVKDQQPIRPRKLPCIYVNDDDKVCVSDYDWDGKSDNFAAFIDGNKIMPMLKLQEYKFTLTETREARTIVLCDEKIPREDLAQIVTSMSPWFYTFGHRITLKEKK